MPEDLSYLSSISEEFSSTGTSAVDTSAGMLRGRPYGGVALLWRHSVFSSVEVVQCDNPRVCAIRIALRDRAILVVSVYMPTDKAENLTEFTDILGAVSAIIDNCSSECVYILGDFNAHPNERFYEELTLFCSEQEWSCADIDFLGESSGCFTYISEANGSKRWLDHCVLTKAAVPSVRRVYVQYDMLWSDHFPLVIECNLDVILQTKFQKNVVQSKIIWGERNSKQIKLYSEKCNNQLRLIHFPLEFQKCAGKTCCNVHHRKLIDELYENIVNVLKEAAVLGIEEHHRKRKVVVGWNRYVGEAHRVAKQAFSLWFWYGKPSVVLVYNDMCEARKVFKSRLRWCQNHEEQIKADILASHHSKSNFRIN